MARDLDRWSGDANAPEELQELLRSARTDVPSARELSGLEGKLAGLLNAPVPPAAAPQPDATTGLGLPRFARIAALVVIGGLVGTGVYLGTRAEEAKPPAPAEAPVSKPLAPERAPATPASAAEAVAPEAEPSATAEATAEPAHTAKAAAKPSEASLLNQAQQALKTDPRRALALTRRHKQLYPQGSLSQEREVIAIEALSRLDKKSSAQERAEQFNEKYPESAHQKKVDTSLKE